MGRRTVAQFANRIKRVLSPTHVNDLGRPIGFCYRERLMTPYRLVLSLLASHAMGPVETLADIHRQFNALFTMTVACKPFHNPLSKDTFKDLMREMLCVILQHWGVEGLRPKARGALNEFGRMLIQDGSSFAVKDALREQYPGRFHKQNPAAVELHVTMSVLDESVSTVTLTPDTAAERPHLPSPRTPCGDLRLADRGYFDREYLNAVSRAGGHDVVRASASDNPMVRRAYDSRGEELREMRGRRLKGCAVTTDERVDPDVAWGTGAKAMEGRYTWLVMPGLLSSLCRRWPLQEKQQWPRPGRRLRRIASFSCCVREMEGRKCPSMAGTASHWHERDFRSAVVPVLRKSGLP